MSRASSTPSAASGSASPTEMSYRRRLMLLAAVAVTLAVALASVVTYVSVRAQLRDSVDDGLRSLASRVNTALVPADDPAPRRLNIDEQRRRRFLLLLPSSPLGEQDGYAQVVSSAGRIQPPQGQPAAQRETYDYYGVNFVGHPNLTRILNVDEMDYFPMRKEFPMEDASRRDKDDEMFGRGGQHFY